MRRGPLRLRQPAALVAAILIVVLPPLAPARADAAPIALGAYIPDAWRDPSLIDRYSAKVGRKPVIVLSYKSWSGPAFDRRELRAVAGRGAVPMISWEPWDDEDRGYPLRAIAAGRYDGYLRRSARDAVAWGRPILLRFAYEMNGYWVPWGLGVHGNAARDFIAAWRHVVAVFRRQGADNVRWVWAPNNDEDGSFPFRSLYPGNRWVDFTGLSGFNWGRRWESFTNVFRNSYATLLRIAPKPVIIAETGSNEEWGDKAAWMASAFRRELPNFAQVRALVWWDVDDPRGDFRVDSSPASLRAFRSSIRSPKYDAGARLLLAAPRLPSRPAVAPPAPEGGYGEPSLLERVRQELHGTVLRLALLALGGFVLATAFVLFRLLRARQGKPSG